MLTDLQPSSSGYFGVIMKYSALEDKHNGIIIAARFELKAIAGCHSHLSAIQDIHLG